MPARQPAPAGGFAETIPAEADTDAADAAARLLGRALTPEELAEGALYDDLRAMLWQARQDADLSQAAIAGRMGVKQSEVSRLETTVGPGTRLGRLRRYLSACNADLALVVRTSQGRGLSWGAAAPTEAPTEAVAPQPTATSAAAIKVQMLDDILALDASLEATGLAASDAALVRHAFLTTLRAAQQRRANGRPEAAAPPAAVPVERAAVAEPEIDWDAVLTAPGPVAAHPAAVASAAEHLAPEGGARPAIRIRGPRR